MTRSIFSSKYDRLCQILIQARQEAGVSQAQLAKCLERPQSFVSKYERKDRRLDPIEFLHIARCLNLSGAELMQRVLSPDPAPNHLAPAPTPPSPFPAAPSTPEP